MSPNPESGIRGLPNTAWNAGQEYKSLFVEEFRVRNVFDWLQSNVLWSRSGPASESKWERYLVVWSKAAICNIARCKLYVRPESIPTKTEDIVYITCFSGTGSVGSSGDKGYKVIKAAKSDQIESVFASFGRRPNGKRDSVGTVGWLLQWLRWELYSTNKFPSSLIIPRICVHQLEHWNDYRYITVNATKILLNGLGLPALRRPSTTKTP